MILTKDPETGWWIVTIAGTHLQGTHNPSLCEGRLCDVHDRRGEEPWASWPLNWREDRAYMEMIDPQTGIGHPTPAQVGYDRLTGQPYASNHGCDGACYDAYDQAYRKETS